MTAKTQTFTPIREETLPVIEEDVTVSKRRVATGRVRVETRTDLVEETVRAELASGDVEVERIPVGREVDHMPDIRTEGDTIVVPVVEEVLVVERRLVLKEELHVKRRTATEAVEVPVTLRKQRAEIVRIPADDPDTLETPSRSED